MRRTGQHPAQEFRERLLGRRDLAPVGQLPGATPARVAVLFALACYADRDLIAAPGRDVLAAITGQTPSTVTKSTLWAVGVGLLERAGGGYHGRATEWRLKVSPHATLPEPRSSRKGDPGAHLSPDERCALDAPKVSPTATPTRGTRGTGPADASPDPWNTPWPSSPNGSPPGADQSRQDAGKRPAPRHVSGQANP